MSKRRLDRMEGALGPKEAVLHWLGEAHAHGSLPAYVASLVDGPEAAHPFVAIPRQVEDAVYASMRGKRAGFISEVAREAVGDTVFLTQLVLGLNVHVEGVLERERLRHAALAWWSRALDAGGSESAERSGWCGGVAMLRGSLLGTERARASAEGRYLDGHDCLFPELATEWRDLCVAAEGLPGAGMDPDDVAVREAERAVRRVILIARTDGLEAAGQHLASDAMANRVGRDLVATEVSDG